MKKIVTTIPLGRMESPHEVAKVASFLRSDESSYVTGKELYRWRPGTDLSVSYCVGMAISFQDRTFCLSVIHMGKGRHRLSSGEVETGLPNKESR